jgi:hypothetical protein
VFGREKIRAIYNRTKSWCRRWRDWQSRQAQSLSLGSCLFPDREPGKDGSGERRGTAKIPKRPEEGEDSPGLGESIKHTCSTTPSSYSTRFWLLVFTLISYQPLHSQHARATWQYGCRSAKGSSNSVVISGLNVFHDEREKATRTIPASVSLINAQRLAHGSAKGGCANSQLPLPGCIDDSTRQNPCEGVPSTTS